MLLERRDRESVVVENIKAVLTPGGIGIVSLPNGLSAPQQLSRLARWIQPLPTDELFQHHLDYLYRRTVQMFDDEQAQVLRTDGTNLFWYGPTLRMAYGRRSFALLNRLNFRLSRLWPLRNVSQFFYVVVRKRPDAIRS